MSAGGVEKIPVDNTVLPHSGYRNRGSNPQIIKKFSQDLPLAQRPQVMHPDSTLDPVSSVAAHQATRFGIFFQDGNVKAQFGKNNCRA